MRTQKGIYICAVALALAVAMFAGEKYVNATKLPERSVKELPAGYTEPSESFIREYAEVKAKQKEFQEAARDWAARIPKDMEFDEQVLAFKPKTAPAQPLVNPVKP